MNQQPVIRIQGLGKRYQLGQQTDLTTSFREMLLAMPRRLARRFLRADGPSPAPAEEPFWALRDVDLEVQPGEVLGIVGRNGSGKSTLLKILSRITRPTAGRVEIHGRVRSLLEIGTGFHDELTGRENIYLNGAILGMRKAEITRKFAEIVDFAEIGRFLDTPVKRYSSGMYVRLAFAVAAHLESEILLVDEVLAVGDVAFQEKCMGKLQDVAGHGRTVLFVSHNMQALRRLCGTGVFLDRGRLKDRGPINTVIDRYLASIPQRGASGEIAPAMHAEYPPDLEIFRVAIVNARGETTDHLPAGEPFGVRLHCRIHEPENGYTLAVLIRDGDGVLLATLIGARAGLEPLRGERGEVRTVVLRAANLFLSGRYELELWVTTTHGDFVDQIEGLHFSVDSGELLTEDDYPIGPIRMRARWTVEPNGGDS